MLPYRAAHHLTIKHRTQGRAGQGRTSATHGRAGTGQRYSTSSTTVVTGAVPSLVATVVLLVVLE